MTKMSCLREINSMTGVTGSLALALSRKFVLVFACQMTKLYIFPPSAIVLVTRVLVFHQSAHIPPSADRKECHSRHSTSPPPPSCNVSSHTHDMTFSTVPCPRFNMLSNLHVCISKQTDVFLFPSPHDEPHLFMSL